MRTHKLTPLEIATRRLRAQQIEQTPFKRVKDLVGYMGALQAQDLAMAKWAVGKRLPGVTQATVDMALDRGAILRTHLLRPTWHLVSSDDIGWMLTLTAPGIAASMKSRHRNLGLTPALVSKCNGIINKALCDSGALTREEIAMLLEKRGIATKGDNRLAHILLCAELDGLICSGPLKERKQTYALLHERVRVKKSLSREEALAGLAHRYFVSRGPATLQDFVWWSGLPARDARTALELSRNTLASEAIGPATYWFSVSASSRTNVSTTVHLLPAYDEFLIAYKDRSAIFPSLREKRVISSNGVFRPTIVVNGTVSGLWTRRTEGAGTTITTECFTRPGREIMKLIEQEACAFASFIGNGTNRKITYIHGVTSSSQMTETQ
jgi:hypothetical protein